MFPLLRKQREREREPTLLAFVPFIKKAEGERERKREREREREPALLAFVSFVKKAEREREPTLLAFISFVKKAERERDLGVGMGAGWILLQSES